MQEKPIEIENHALGYHITYFLDRFEMDFGRKRLGYTGYPLFEEMIPFKPSVKKGWTSCREQSYKGSLIHFMRTLRENTLMQEDFIVRQCTPERPQWLGTKTNEAIKVGKQITDTRSLFNGDVLSYKGIMQVTYKGDVPGVKYRILRKESEVEKHQHSLVHFNDSVKIYGNGYCDNVDRIFLEGYFAWAEKVSELLPLEYISSVSKRK